VKGQLIAKVKFWFGKDEDIFKSDVIVESIGGYTYIYQMVRGKERGELV